MKDRPVQAVFDLELKAPADGSAEAKTGARAVCVAANLPTGYVVRFELSCFHIDLSVLHMHHTASHEERGRQFRAGRQGELHRNTARLSDEMRSRLSGLVRGGAAAQTRAGFCRRNR